jgi:hypothetical protein
LLQLPEILERLRSLPFPVVDRSVIEELFTVGRRRAIYLLHSFGGFQSGKTFLIDRLQLIARLENIRDGAEFREEQQRRVRLSQHLEHARKLAPGKRVQIAQAAELRDYRLADLPAGIYLKPGQLTIAFSTTEELLQRLYELSQAILNDYGRFKDVVEE